MRGHPLYLSATKLLFDKQGNKRTDVSLGAPIDITPFRDNPAFAKRQDFRFDPNSQERCPYAAHIRKTNPRSDLGDGGATFNRSE